MDGMKKWLWALALMPGLASAVVFDAEVVAVSDGDTITVTVDEPCVQKQSCFKGKKAYRIRFAEIDAPERTQPGGIEARDVLREQIYGQTVYVDWSGAKSYSRIVAQVFHGDQWLNGYMVEQGYAWVEPRYAKTRQLWDLQESAQQAQVGIWATPMSELTPPWEYRKSKRANLQD